MPPDHPRMVGWSYGRVNGRVVLRTTLEWGMPPDHPRMVVPSALPLKLICDVTRL